MTARRPGLDGLPAWPRYLSREQAAVYVGVSPETFEAEVSGGLWPAARRRGGKAGRLTWDRCALDAAADRDSGLDDPDIVPTRPSLDWSKKRGTANRDRNKEHPKQAA